MELSGLDYFMRHFMPLQDVSNLEWQAIHSHIARFGRQPLPPSEYLDAIREYYQL